MIRKSDTSSRSIKLLDDQIAHQAAAGQLEASYAEVRSIRLDLAKIITHGEIQLSGLGWEFITPATQG